jgi:hypothetical protein
MVVVAHHLILILDTGQNLLFILQKPRFLVCPQASTNDDESEGW